MLKVNVAGGTNAGIRVVKAQPRNDWVCPVCGKRHRYYWTSCPTDGTPRPEDG